MFLIHLYNVLHLLILPFYIIVAIVRLVMQKESGSSILQKFGIYSSIRPKGKIIWIHAASVGESVIALTLINYMVKKYPDHKFLITTITLSSAKIIQKNLSSRILHQFLPVDTLLTVNRFLKYWQPNLGIFIESELWPCIITSASKKVPLLLINARLSDKSYRHWQYYPALFQAITNRFSLVLTQSKKDRDKFHNLGYTKPINLGNIKFSNMPLNIDNTELEKIHKQLLNKNIFLAASTHKEDEEIILPIIKKHRGLNLYYPIIVLRHPEKRQRIIDLCNKLGLSYELRSQTNLPKFSKDLYIVDTFSELGLFYSLSTLTFVGGSFYHGGHNVAEPAFFNNIILFGPDMSNFQNIAEDMVANKAALQITHADELSSKLENIFTNLAENNVYQENSLKYVNNKKEIIHNYIQHIKCFL
ncbi:MAG: hypothetical protein DGJ47_000849 [Rickettsiaceae bacterium]